MNIDLRNDSQSNEKKWNNTPLTSEELLTFESNQSKSKEISKQSEIESQLWMIELYKKESPQYQIDWYIIHDIQQWDTLSKITQEYYGNIEVWKLLSEITGVEEKILIWNPVILPSELSKEYPLKQERLQEVFQEQLKQIDKTLKQLDEINWNLRFWENNQIDIGRLNIYTEISREDIWELSVNNLKLFDRLNRFLEAWGWFSDIDEELIIYYLSTKEKKLQKLQEIKPLDELDNHTQFYHEIEAQVKQIEKKLSQFNLRDEASLENLNNEQKLELEYLTIKYEFFKTIQMDYLSSIYTDWWLIDMRYAKNYAESMERNPFNNDSTFLTDITDFLSDINGLRWMWVRWMTLWGELLKHKLRKELYHPNESIDGNHEAYLRKIIWEEVNIISIKEIFASSWLSIEALWVWITEWMIDIYVAYATIVLTPEQLVKDVKKLPYLISEFYNNFSEYYEQAKEYIANNPDDAALNGVYWIWYIASMIFFSNFLPWVPNVVSILAVISGRWIWKWWKMVMKSYFTIQTKRLGKKEKHIVNERDSLSVQNIMKSERFLKERNLDVKKHDFNREMKEWLLKEEKYFQDSPNQLKEIYKIKQKIEKSERRQKNNKSDGDNQEQIFTEDDIWIFKRYVDYSAKNMEERVLSFLEKEKVRYSGEAEKVNIRIQGYNELMSHLNRVSKNMDRQIKEITDKASTLTERWIWNTQDVIQYGSLAVKYGTLFSVLNATLENFMLDEYGGEILEVTKWVLSQEFEKIRESWKRSRDVIKWDIYRQIQKHIQGWGLKVNEFNLWRLDHLIKNEDLILPEKEIAEWDREMKVALNIVSAVELFLRKLQWADADVIDGKIIWNTIVDKLMIKFFDVKVNIVVEDEKLEPSTTK